jgi:alpha-1,2-mannosyltransferase
MRLTQPLTPAQAGRIRLHLVLIPVYAWLILVWTSYAIDLSPAGRLDRSGHIKGHDFAHPYVLGQIALDRAPDELYSFAALSARTDRLVPEYADRFLPVHGPQISMFFAPLAMLPYGAALTAWLLFTAIAYAFCCRTFWVRSPSLRRYRWLALVLAAGYPPFYQVIANGQTAAIALVCITMGYLAFRSGQPLLAGFALGSLFYKPSLGLALPIVLLYGREGRALTGAAAAVLLQLAIPAAYYGVGVLPKYFKVASGFGQVAPLLEPQPFQMQSLRSFFSILLPWPHVALLCYVAAAGVVVGIAARCWRTPAPIEFRYSLLLLATILIDPHVNSYDLVVLAPVFILVAGWMLDRGLTDWRAWTLLYACYFLPALTFIPTATHVQVSVLALAGLTAWLAHQARFAARLMPSEDRP